MIIKSNFILVRVLSDVTCSPLSTININMIMGQISPHEHMNLYMWLRTVNCRLFFCLSLFFSVSLHDAMSQKGHSTHGWICPVTSSHPYRTLKPSLETSREEQLHFTDTQSDTNPEVSHNKLFCQSQWVAPACALHASESIRKKN